MALSALKSLVQKNQKQFEQNKELAEKMRKGLTIALVNNLSSGTFCYYCPITRQEMTLDQYQQVMVMNFEQFNSLVNNHKKLLKGFAIMPIQCEVEGYTEKEGNELLNEVLKMFGLSSIYQIDENGEGGYYLFENAIDEMIKLSYRQFVETLNEIPLELLEKTVKRAIDLVKSEELTDAKKIKYFISVTENPDLFTDDYIESNKNIRKIR